MANKKKPGITQSGSLSGLLGENGGGDPYDPKNTYGSQGPRTPAILRNIPGNILDYFHHPLSTGDITNKVVHAGQDIGGALAAANKATGSGKKKGQVATTGASPAASPAAPADPFEEAVSAWATPQGFNPEGFRSDVMSGLSAKDQKDPAKIKAAVDAALSQAGYKKAWMGGSGNATGVGQAISPAVMQMYMAGLSQNLGDMSKQFAGSSGDSMQKMNEAYKAMGVTPSATTNALNLERANLGQNMAQNAVVEATNAPFMNQFLQSLSQNNSLIQQLVREQQYAAAKNSVVPGGQIPGVNTSNIGAGTGIPGVG